MSGLPTESPAYHSFDRVATAYEGSRVLPAENADAVATYLANRVTPDDWFLDAATGTGRFARALVRHHPRLIGVDISPNMLAEQRRLSGNGPIAHLALTDLRSLPFDDATFAGVLAVHIFHLIADWERAVREVWRVLQPGGTFFMGYEERSGATVRAHYNERLVELGVKVDRLGADSKEIVPLLVAEGGTVTEVRREDWTWERTVTVGQSLDTIDARLYSHQWSIPEDAHQVAMQATRAWAAETFPSLGTSETITSQVALYEVVKSR